MSKDFDDDDDEEQRKAKVKYINTLLNIDQYSGESKTRMAPKIIYLCVAGVPLLIWVYAFMRTIPLPVILVIEVIWAGRWALLILGEENKRVAQYKKQMYDKYSTSYELLGIRVIHDSGLIEFINGQVGYILVAENGNKTDNQARTRGIHKLLFQLRDHYVPDIYIQNISIGEVLADRYANVSFFEDKDVMNDCIKLLDHNIEIADAESYLTRLVFVIHASKSQFKDLKINLDGIVKSCDPRAFKSLIIADKRFAEKVISRDLDTYIDYEELIQKRYAKGEYDTSEVLNYDVMAVNTTAYELASDSDEEVGFINESED